MGDKSFSFLDGGNPAGSFGRSDESSHLFSNMSMGAPTRPMQQQQQQGPAPGQLPVQGSMNPMMAGKGTQPTSSLATTPAPSSEGNSYNLMGLLKVIRKTDKDQEMLGIGSDLTTLGINLSSNEYVFCYVAGLRG